jgi:hypothetical protein
MADTGAPWNIPYVTPTDNPRVFPAADEAQALAIAAGLSSASVIGQIIQTVKDDTFSTTSADFVDVTGLTSTITPSSATNKVLIIASVASWDQVSVQRSGWTVTQGTTNLVVPDSPGSRVAVANWISSSGQSGEQVSMNTFVLLHSPASTSATEYRIRARTESTATTFFCNRTANDTNSAGNARPVSTLTLIEVVA